MGNDPRHLTPQLDRARGAMFGLAIGDALGMPTQEFPRERAAQLLRDQWFVAAPSDQPVSAGLAAGHVTDDTEQTLLMAKLLVDGDGHIDAMQLAARLLEWEDAMAATGSLDLLGPSTKRALLELRAGADVRSSGRFGATNGAAMRITPVAIATAGANVDVLVASVVAADLPTHNTGVAHAGAAAVAAVVSAGVDGAGFFDALPFARACAVAGSRQGYWFAGADVSARIGWAIDEAGRPGLTSSERLDHIAALVGTSLATQESVPAAFAVASLFPEQPFEAALAAAGLGGDSDTIASIVGAMLGATNGLAAWPVDAVECVRRVNHLQIDDLVDGLLSLRARA